MNFEHLCKTIKNNNHKLKDKKKTQIFIKNIVKILKKNIRRLKLGKVVFEFKRIVYGEITIHEGIEMRYIRQDTTREDELKIENRLEALKWQWDFKNIAAFFIVMTIGFVLLYAQLYLWYCNNLPTLAFKDPAYNDLIYFFFESSFSSPLIKTLRSMAYLNFWLINALTDFSINFNLFF